MGSPASTFLKATPPGAVRALHRNRESRRGPEDGRIAVALHRRGPAGPPPPPPTRGANDRAVSGRCPLGRGRQSEIADLIERTRRASTSVRRHVAVIAVPTPVRFRASVRPRPADGPEQCIST